MAKPRGKTLQGRESGKKAQHWYDFVKPRRHFLKSRLWDGGCPSSKPGVKIMVWMGFDEQGKERWEVPKD